MCVPGCHEAISRHLSRRGLFKGAGAAALAAAAFSTPRPSHAATSFSKVVDLTHPLSAEFPTFSGKPQIEVRKLLSLEKDGYNLNEWVLNEHTGTHLDAPLHFSKDGVAADQIDVENLVVPLAVIDVTAEAAANADYQVTSADIRAYEAANGPIPRGACIALMSGWDKFVSGGKFRNPDSSGGLHFPGFHPDAVQLLLEKEAAGVAVDTLSLDHGASKDFAFHYKWLGSGRWGLECVANLAEVPAKGATLVLGGPKVKGATGGPSRVLALV